MPDDLSLPSRFTFSMEIDQSLLAIDDLVEKSRELPSIPQIWAGTLRQSAIVTSVYASTSIEGNALTEEQVGRVLRRQRVAAAERDIREVENYRQAMQWVFDTQDRPATDITLADVLLLHRLVVEGIAECGPAGQVRQTQNFVVNKATGERLFLPPAPDAVTPLMEHMAVRLRRDGELHFAIRAALAHLWLVAIHPFNDGNGRVARLLANTILVRSAPHFGGLTDLETHFFEDRERYWQVIAQSLGPSYTGDRDITSWVAYFVDSVRLRFKAPLHVWRTVGLVERTLGRQTHPEPELSRRSLAAAILALLSGRVTAGAYREATGVSARTASYDLAQLVRSGWLDTRGQRRGRHYVASARLRELVEGTEL